VATISDLFGNSASDTGSGVLRIDTIAPALSISSSSSSRDYFPLLSGSSEAGAPALILIKFRMANIAILLNAF